MKPTPLEVSVYVLDGSELKKVEPVVAEPVQVHVTGAVVAVIGISVEKPAAEKKKSSVFERL